MILVEHDMGLVMDIADRVLVLDFGEPIAHRPARPRSRRTRAVIDAYLGQAAHDRTAVEARPRPDGATPPPRCRRCCCARGARPKDATVALRKKQLGRWEEFSWTDYATRRATQRRLGLREPRRPARRQGRRLAENRPGVAASPTSASRASGGVRSASTRRARKPRSVTSSANSVAEIVIVEDEEQVDKALLVRDQLPDLRKIVVIDTRGIRHRSRIRRRMSLEELEAWATNGSAARLECATRGRLPASVVGDARSSSTRRARRAAARASCSRTPTCSPPPTVTAEFYGAPRRRGGRCRTSRCATSPNGWSRSINAVGPATS